MFRRPMVAAAVSVATGIVFSRLADNAVSLLLILISAAASAGLLFYLAHRWKILELIENIYKINRAESDCDIRELCRKMLIFMMLFFVTGAVSGKIALSKNSALEESIAKRSRIEGIVSSVSIKGEEKYNLIVNMENGERLLIYVKGYKDNAVDYVGALVSISGKPELPSGASFPNGFDYRLYLKSKKIYICMYVKEAAIRVVKEPEGLWKIYNGILSLKHKYEKDLFERMDAEAAGVFCGILFGDTSLMDEEILESFRAEGIGHLLAASGLHVGFVYALIRMMLRRRTSIWGNLIIIAIMFVYAALAGFSASVIRAVFMITVHIFSQILHRRYDFLSCIAFCFICMLAWEPTQLFAGGFQFTFLAVATLAVILKRLEKGFGKYSRLEERLKLSKAYAEGEKVSIALSRRIKHDAVGIIGIQAGLAPATATGFHYISPAAFLLNLPAIAVAGLAVPLGLIMMLFYICADMPVIEKVADTVYGHMIYICEMLLHLLMWMNNAAENSVLHARMVSAPSKFIILIYYFCIFFFCSEIWKRAAEQLKFAENSGTAETGGCSAFCRGLSMKGTFAVLASAILLCGGVCAAAEWEYMRSELLLLSDGETAAVHVKVPLNTDILVNCGGSSSKDAAKELYIPYFLSNGIKDLELVILTDLEKEHCSALKTMSETIRVKKLAIPEVYSRDIAKLEEVTGISSENIVFLKDRDTISVSSVKFQVHIAASDFKDREEDNRKNISHKMHVQVYIKDKNMDVGENCLSKISKEHLDKAALSKKGKEGRFTSLMIDLDDEICIRDADGRAVADCKKSL